MRYARFGLILVVNHACNLRCSYCYSGAKFNRPMPEEIGRRAIDRALRSLDPGGTLELGFFGGEPLLEAELIGSFIHYTLDRAKEKSIGLTLGMTTNGTIVGDAAWRVLKREDLDLAISFDGTPEVHDRHRIGVDGRGSSAVVLGTIRRLIDIGRPLRVVMVVRPDNVAELASGVVFLRELGVRYVEPSLDLWTRWTPDDVNQLEKAVSLCAWLWHDGLPEYGLSWFDEKAAQLAAVPTLETARCGFGSGEIAVAPSGRLYPCERLVGEDRADSPTRLPGHVLNGTDFLNIRPAARREHEECSACAMESVCNTICRCSNFVRSGNVKSPDALLCRWNQACLNETLAVLETAKHGAQIGIG